MKKKDVEINELYLAVVSGKKVPVKLISSSPYDGWIGRNMLTGKKVRIKTADRLQFKMTEASSSMRIARLTRLLGR